MVNLSHDRCCGCGACVAICPKKAVSMSESEYGFVFPETDAAKCTDCGLCARACPEITLRTLLMPGQVYAACCNDTTELASCASGGVATAMGREFVRRGGAVYGCSQKNYRTIRHIRVEREEDLALLKGSKYVQSDMVAIYADVRSDLKSGRKVLFVGTPCQVAALYGYLQKPYDNLTTVDLLCHGVPSQSMLREAVESATKQCDAPANDIFVNFRWKTRRGIQRGIQFGNNDQVMRTVPANREPYMTAFLKNLSLRESCYKCRYATSKRIGDLTIGDFWGLGRKMPSKLKSKYGVSLVMINTTKGNALWGAISGGLTVEQRTAQEAIAGNSILRKPSQEPIVRKDFLKNYASYGLHEAVRKADFDYRVYSNSFIRFVCRSHTLEKVIGFGCRGIRKLKSFIK